MNPTPSVLVDSSFLYALYDQSDQHHARVLLYTQLNSPRFLVPDVVLTEVTYLMKRAGGVQAIAKFLETMQRVQLPLEPITYPDLERASEIMLIYQSASFDFVDSCIMAMSERFGITQVATLDERDFRIFQPKHTDYLELHP